MARRQAKRPRTNLTLSEQRNHMFNAEWCFWKGWHQDGLELLREVAASIKE